MKCKFNDNQVDIKRSVKCCSLHFTLFEKLALLGPSLSDWLVVETDYIDGEDRYAKIK